MIANPKLAGKNPLSSGKEGILVLAHRIATCWAPRVGSIKGRNCLQTTLSDCGPQTRTRMWDHKTAKPVLRVLEQDSLKETM